MVLHKVLKVLKWVAILFSGLGAGCGGAAVDSRMDYAADGDPQCGEP